MDIEVETAEVTFGLLEITRILYPDPAVEADGMVTEIGLDEPEPISVGEVKLPLELLNSTEKLFPELKDPVEEKPTEKDSPGQKAD
jgi:hypothetical protein